MLDIFALIKTVIVPLLAIFGFLNGLYKTYGIPHPLRRTRAFNRREQLLRKQRRMKEEGKAYPNAMIYFNGIMALVLLAQLYSLWLQANQSEGISIFLKMASIAVPIMLVGYWMIRSAFIEIMQNEEQAAKDTLPIMLAELNDEIDMYLNPDNWERTSYSNGQWTYKRKEIDSKSS